MAFKESIGFNGVWGLGLQFKVLGLAIQDLGCTGAYGGGGGGVIPIP